MFADDAVQIVQASYEGMLHFYPVVRIGSYGHETLNQCSRINLDSRQLNVKPQYLVLNLKQSRILNKMFEINNNNNNVENLEILGGGFRYSIKIFSIF